MHTFVHTYINILAVLLHTYIHTYIPKAGLNIYIHSYIHTYSSSLTTYIHTYIHLAVLLHTYIHTRGGNKGDASKAEFHGLGIECLHGRWGEGTLIHTVRDAEHLCMYVCSMHVCIWEQVCEYYFVPIHLPHGDIDGFWFYVCMYVCMYI